MTRMKRFFVGIISRRTAVRVDKTGISRILRLGSGNSALDLWKCFGQGFVRPFQKWRRQKPRGGERLVVPTAGHALWSLSGRSLIALGLGLGALAFEAPEIVSRSVAAEASRSPTTKVPLIYQKKRAFRIPFHIDAKVQARIKEVQLWVSEDSGFNWEAKSRTTPDLGKFTFRTSHDGEFWFATRTVTIDDEYSPPMSETVEPSMKVVVDSIPPSLVLDPDGRRGSMAAVRWEVKDEHLDLKSLVLEYQVEGAREWRKVPIRRLSLLGAQSWDAGTADSLRVRGSVADKSGNVADAEIVLPEGTAGASDLAAVDGDSSLAPPVEQISGGPGSQISAGPGFPAVQEDEGTSPRRSLAARRSRLDNRSASSASPAAPDWDRGGSVASEAPRGRGKTPSQGPAFADPFPMTEPDNRSGNAGIGNDSASAPPASTSLQGGAANGGNRSILAQSPRFRLQYAVEDAGPNGPATVELWITQDGGRTWIRRGEDSDKVSPFEVDLGGEGTFGISLVARSASGMGDQPPAPGDPPQTWVEVDSTPPSVHLYPPKIGTGPHAGKVAITWLASDLHLAPRSVSLYWRPDQPGANWQPITDGLENSGQYVWTVPPSFPSRFHIRVEAIDNVGHHGAAETTDSSPVIVDRSRPRSRIIGLDPNARAADGPSAVR
jgi:hypothetical protein